jgi:hypothetical protein
VVPLTKPYSGRLNVRLPVELHASLAAEAANQDVSLNTLIVTLLARGIGWERPHDDQSRGDEYVSLGKLVYVIADMNDPTDIVRDRVVHPNPDRCWVCQKFVRNGWGQLVIASQAVIHKLRHGGVAGDGICSICR